MPPLRLDPSASARRSLEVSPSRSSVHSAQAYTPASSLPSTPVYPVRPQSLERKPPHPGDSNAFLTALAAQERLVLELREELQKAEGDLEKLKKQWATYEATKKRNELRHVEALQPLKTSMSAAVSSCDDELNMAGKELGRRNMAPPPKPSRTVFSGSRHTRTLSLLSSRAPKVSGSQLPTTDSGLPRRHRFSVNEDAIPITKHELRNATDGSNDSARVDRGPPKDVILETGKQIVGDFRHGLWTFFEDLRHVTVGEEAASTPDAGNRLLMPAVNTPKAQARKQNVSGGRRSLSGKAEISSASPVERENSGAVDIDVNDGGSGRMEKGVNAGSLPQADHESASNMTINTSDSNEDDDDVWDSWDTVTTKGSTPRGKNANFTADALASPLTDKSSPRTSTSSVDATRPPKNPTDSAEGDKTSWPMLTNLSPSRLTKTTSTMMSEWEKSLADPSV